MAVEETVIINQLLLSVSGQSTYNWLGSKLKEAGNIATSWSKSLENTVKKFCISANKSKKQNATTKKVDSQLLIKLKNSKTIEGRDKARDYMEAHAYSPNSKYPYWDSKGGNCANYTSQVMSAGGIEQTDEWYMTNGNIIDEIKSHLWDKGKYNVSDGKKYTSSWSSASEQYKYFSNPTNGYINGEVLNASNSNEVSNLVKNNNIQVGDLLYWDHNGNGVTHATVISKVDKENGKIYFSGNTDSRLDREVTNKNLADYKGGIYIVRIKDEYYQ